jgi:hypothetical protein
VLHADSAHVAKAARLRSSSKKHGEGQLQQREKKLYWQNAVS